ncbi:hypothetical protein LOTGIDRAFT_114480 [Lottia gigantea]|uniref:SLC26A/SulP transporter domain-containing protein n=1 Tax=Lottia gigantea TaxID=225164 RepID=V4A3J0_LOTGI|nr:hypothetical protein LOTGIDRAFT_114480 [Lottia gigantea]ESO98413.1 hypothetical protein LOTGIDRAFT_114480 [Lottia gigantea]
MSLASSLSTAFILSDTLCVAYDDPLRTKLFCSTLFMCGVCSVLQTTLGVRLPVYQGPSASFIVPLLALRRDIRWSCTDNTNNGVWTEPMNQHLNLSGSLMIASLIEIIIGGTGLVAPLLKYIGPITVAPTISLIGLSLVKVPIIYSRPQWVIAFFGALLVLIFSLYLYKIKIPMPRLNCLKKNNDEKLKPRSQFAIFQILPILLSIIILWIVAAILTITDTLSTDPESLEYKARTDSKLNIVSMTPWFSIPYPGQFGLPRTSTAVIVGFSAATISSLIESVGDYFAAAKSCQVPAPPDHAITRGILIEGIGSILSGAVGVGHATTSYSGNIAAITLSKVILSLQALKV